MIAGSSGALRDRAVSTCRAPGSRRLCDYLIIALLVLGSRALLLLIAAGSTFAPPSGGRVVGADLLSLFVRWDANWYLRIATTGYEALAPPDELPLAKPHAFFPVYPLLIRAVSALTTLEPAATGILVSTVLFALALVLIHEYVQVSGLPREVGLGTALLLCCAPHSFVFSSVYAESTFLCLLAAAMLAFRTQRYVWAGIAAALLSATRPNGVLFVVFALAWTWRAMGRQALARPWTAGGPWLAIALAPLGLVAYWWFCLLTTGDAFAQKSTVSHGWGWAADWPWANLSRHLAGASISRFWAWGSLLYFAASLLLLRMRRHEEFIFCLASFLLFWTAVPPQSLVRYAVVLFPIFIGLAAATIGRPVLFATLAAGLAGLNGFLVVAFVLNWRIAV